MNENSITVEQIAAENQRYMVKVYSWMSLAMIITGAVAIYTASNETLRNLIHSNNWIFFGLIIFEFIAVGVLVKLVNKMSVPLAMLIFILYSVLN